MDVDVDVDDSEREMIRGNGRGVWLGWLGRPGTLIAPENYSGIGEIPPPRKKERGKKPTVRPLGGGLQPPATSFIRGSQASGVGGG